MNIMFIYNKNNINGTTYIHIRFLNTLLSSPDIMICIGPFVPYRLMHDGNV